MKIKLSNIQSFQNAMYEFPDTGLVQIIGGNSNGKSILEKVLKSIATCEFTSQEERDSLIRDGKDNGYVIIEYKGKVLSVFLSRERNACNVTLVRADGTRITRTIRDGGLDKLIEEFGFCVYGKRAVVLQLHETFGIIPFVNTSNALNYEITEAVTTDTVAQQFLSNFKEVTHKRAKEVVKEYSGKITNLTAMLQGLVVYNYREYEALLEKMQKCYSVLKYLSPIKVEKIIAPPKVKYLEVPQIKLEKVQRIELYPVIEKLECLTPTLRRIRDFEEGICPTCGRRYDERSKTCLCE